MEYEVEDRVLIAELKAELYEVADRVLIAEFKAELLLEVVDIMYRHTVRSLRWEPTKEFPTKTMIRKLKRWSKDNDIEMEVCGYDTVYAFFEQDGDRALARIAFGHWCLKKD